jgi:hypothetical protein
MKFPFCNSTQQSDAPKPDVTLELRQLSEQVLTEIVREAETMIASQYQSHLASEQRGLAIFGIGLTTSSVLTGAYLTIDRTVSNGILLANSSFWLAVGLSISASLALCSVWPRTFNIPGNEPKNWLPEHWPAGVKRTLKQTRLEQCKVVQDRISDNRKTANRKARLQRFSILVGGISVLLCGAYTICAVDFTIAAK